MVTTLLLEPYRLPQFTSIFVTILRGPRRMRFSRQLRKNYQDFAPRLWAILQRLGYKKFLQRIYIDIDIPVTISHHYYEWPILLAVLGELKLLPNSTEMFALGKISLEQKIFLPDHIFRAINDFFDGKLHNSDNNSPLLTALNQIGQQKYEFPKQKLTSTQSPKFTLATTLKQRAMPILYKLLLPGFLFPYGYLQLENTPLSLLQKIESEFLRQIPLIWADLQNLPDEKLFHWLALNREHLNLTVQTTMAQKKEREDFFSPLFS